MADSYDVFGSYILLKGVFRDDLGRLFRAGAIESDSIDRKIWLRVLDGAGLKTSAITESFEGARLIGEAVTCAQLPKEPIFLECNGFAALGHNYVAGQPLNRVLARARDEAFPLQPDNSLLIVEKIALALAAGEAVELSGKPLAHGFLHPGLIFLSNDGEATVTGFGLGGALLENIGDPEAVNGVRAYLSPETITGLKPNRRGDVYSLGAILFHLLTGTALPVSPDERAAALEAAHVAWDGEALASDLQSILRRSLAPSSSGRFASAADFRTELDKLIYGGAYSPTTFNLALFMDRLFRSEIEGEEAALQTEAEIDVTPYIGAGSKKEDPVPDVVAPDPGEGLSEPEATPPATEKKGNRGLWIGIAGTAVIGIAATIFWFTRGTAEPQVPPTPTPTAEEIASRRQAQEDRLRTLTQDMVKEMMAEREEEIRQELITRQTRIEELQLRLQKSENRAAQSSAAAASEAETQKKLMQEIEEQEAAQRIQQEKLEAERLEAMKAAAEASAVEAAEAGAVVLASDSPSPVEDAGAPTNADPQALAVSQSPTAPPRPTPMPVAASVKFGDFVSPENVDTVPVVIKSQSLTWPRNAQKSKGRGVVVVQQTVNAGGGIDEVVVLRADHTGWGIPEAALEAAKGYRYKPGTKNGTAITTHAFVTWRYDFTTP